MEAVKVAFDRLLTLLEVLPDADWTNKVIQRRLSRLSKLQNRRAGSKNASRTGCSVICAGDLHVHLAPSAHRLFANALSHVTRAVSRHETVPEPFAEFHLVQADSPALSLLATFVRHNTTTKTELKILALLVAHSVDAIFETEDLSYDDIISNWTASLGLERAAVASVECLGRFCLGLLGDPANGSDCDTEPSGLGILAMLDAYGTSLKALAGSGYKFLLACKRIDGVERTALQVASTIGVSLQRLIKHTGLDVNTNSCLGRVLVRLQTLPRTSPPMSSITSEDGDGIDRQSARALLLLLCQFPTHTVSRQVLVLGLAPQARWSSSGEAEDRLPSYRHERHPLSRLNPDKLDNVIRRCVLDGSVVEGLDGILMARESARRQLKQELCERQSRSWKEYALQFVCHAFPRGKTLCQRYRAIGAELLPLLRHTLAACPRLDDCDVLATLLAAAPLAQCGEYDAEIERLRCSLPFSSVVVHANRRLFRTECSQERLACIFDDSVSRARHAIGADSLRLNVQMGNLRTAYAGRLCHYTSLNSARAILAPWRPWNETTLSTLEQMTMERFALVQAQIDMFSGDPDAALARLQPLFAHTVLQDEGYRTEVVCTYATVSRDVACLDAMPPSVLPQSQLSALRRLHEADILFELDDFGAALSSYENTRALHCTSTQLVRAHVGAAKCKHRLSHDDTVDCWRGVETCMEELKWSKGFAWALVQLSLAALEERPATERVEAALHVLRREDHAMWLPLGKEWVVLPYFCPSIALAVRTVMNGVSGWNRAIRLLAAVQAEAVMARSQGGVRRTPREKAQAALGLAGLNMNNIAFLHIAGTKGKGTTALYLEDLILTHHRQRGITSRVGCLTSPHVVDLRERIRIDGTPVGRHAFAESALQWESLLPALPTMFWPTFLTIVAFSMFISEGVQVAIIETGIGGETDSTNVIERPVATGITEIGMDHTDRLGHTIEQIAWHKGGIMKKHSPCYSVPQCAAAGKVLKQRALERETTVSTINDDFLVQHRIPVHPDASYQRMNAALALSLCNAYVSHSGQPPMSISVADCLRTTELPAKFERIERDGITWILSSAHNEMSIRRACEAFLSVSSHTAPAMIFSHDGSRDSTALLQTLHTTMNAMQFECSVFCSAELESSMDDGDQGFLDSRTSTEARSRARHRNAAAWQSISGNHSTTIVPTVDAAIRAVKGHFGHSQQRTSRPERVAIIVGCAYTAGMARMLLL